MMKDIKAAFKLANDYITKGQELGERYILTSLKLLSELRYVLNSLIFCLITHFYSHDSTYRAFSIVFLGLSAFDYLNEKYGKIISVKKSVQNAIQTIIISCSIITLAMTIKFMINYYKNFDSVVLLVKNLVSANTTTFGKIFVACKLFSIPLATVFTLYTRYKQYKDTPSYRKDTTSVNMINGLPLNVDVMNQKWTVPYAQMFSIFVNCINSKNKIALLATVVDMLLGFVKFTGHKQNTLLSPLLFSSIVSVFLSLITFSETLQNPMLIDNKTNVNTV